jgi:hypothetical protein
VKPILRAVYALLHSLATLPGVGRLFGGWLRPVTVQEIITSGVIRDGEIYGPSQAITSLVQEFGTPFVTPDPERYPAVGWRVVEDATAVTTRHYPYLVHGNHMMIGARRNPGPWQVVKRGNHVVWQSGFRALVNLTRGDTIQVDGAILLGGHSHTNWYHWLVDALPQLHTARLLPEPYRAWPVVVPDEIFRYPTMVETVDLFLDGRDVIRVAEGTRVRGTLCWVDSLEISNLPESLVTPRPLSQIHLLHKEGMHSYRRVFLDRFGDHPSPWGERIFITRTGTRRAYNQDEIADIAREFGFTVVAPESLSLAEQVALFSHATHIIGPSGAGFGGMLFASPGTHVLCWQDSRLTHMTILPDLATLTDSHYWHLFYEPLDGGIFTGNYHLDPEKIRQSLQEFVSGTS